MGRDYKVTKNDNDWRAELSDDQYAVLRESATERPFSGELLYNDVEGVYKCAACGNVLFKSDAKYVDPYSGWPSFRELAKSDAVVLQEDLSHGMTRTEVRCANCDSHLGHLFDDGPGPDHNHYCINSLALNFEPKQDRDIAPDNA